MNKNYTLLSAILLFGSVGFAQNSLDDFNYQGKKVLPRLGAVESLFIEGTKADRSNAKAFGDTLYYQPFTDSLPDGYRIINNNANNFVWTWDTLYQTGRFSGAVPPINSTTGSTGFMSLPSDNYNSPNGNTQMDTYFISDKITFASSRTSVFIQYQQYMAFCCSAANELVLEISLDSLNWGTPFDLSRGLPVNSANVGIAVAVASEQINVSSVLAGETEFWYRVRSTGNVAYWWMIDDIAFIEGPSQNLELENSLVEFNSFSYGLNPFYGFVPNELLSPLRFSGNVSNNGGVQNTNVSLDVAVTHVADINGGTGTGIVYNTSSLYGTLAPLADSNNFTPLPAFEPTVRGTFNAGFKANGDSVDQIPGNDTANFSFFIGDRAQDSVFARDDNTFAGGISPASFVSGATGTPGGTADGDRMGVLYVVEGKSGNSARLKPTSLTFAVSANVRNIGVEIVPRIWEFNEDSATLAAAFGNVVANSFVPYTVQASDTNSLLTLPFDPNTPALDSGQYVAGWEVTGGTVPANPADPTNIFQVQVDGSTGLNQPGVTTFIWFGHDPGWGTIAPTNPVIRMNFRDITIPVGIEDVENVSDVKFQVAPNPNNGQFNLNISSDQAINYNLNVRNMVGQTIRSESITVNGSMVKPMDISSLKKGIYFVSLENENERLVKKVIVK